VDTLIARLERRQAIVAVVGLGYVGLPLLVASAAEGFDVVGVDADGARVASLKAGRSPVGDVSADDLRWAERGQFSTDPRVLIAADVVVVAVPTPLRDGTPDLSLVSAAMADVAAVLRPGQLVILESTTYPGTTEELVRPILEGSGFRAGTNFWLAYSPERIDPGTGRSLRDTPKLVAGIGADDTAAAVALYGALVDHVVTTSSPRQAEAAKLIENIFRQVNIALVNELATIAPAVGVDIWEALDAAATKSFGYMPFWPGPGVGGHCIAVDPSYLSWRVEQQLGFGIGFIEHARTVNNRMPTYVAGRVADALNGVGKAMSGSRVVVLGLIYKPGVDDVRVSPALSVLQRLVASGADCAYHDPRVASAVVAGRRATDVLRADEPVRLQSEPLTSALLEESDCVVILTAHPGIDYSHVVGAAPLVFDAVGVTREHRAAHVVLL
jgi:UDP-N-acetyl-D-glucosamine dehydrogenase